MTNSLFADKKEIFKTVIKLAEDRRIFYERNRIDYMPISEYIKSTKYMKMSEKEKALQDYLESLDIEDVKTLQTIMYLGRDEDYNEKETYEERYKGMRSYRDTLGWNSKAIEVSQMVEKVPLDQYLRRGLEILNITL